MLLLVVPTHPVCHWIVVFPGVGFGADIIPALRRPIGWHRGITTCLFTFTLMILSFIYHLSRQFWVIFQGNALHWKSVLMVLIWRISRNFSLSVEIFFQHKNRNFVSPSSHVMFYLLYKHQWITKPFHFNSFLLWKAQFIM